MEPGLLRRGDLCSPFRAMSPWARFCKREIKSSTSQVYDGNGMNKLISVKHLGKAHDISTKEISLQKLQYPIHLQRLSGRLEHKWLCLGMPPYSHLLLSGTVRFLVAAVEEDLGVRRLEAWSCLFMKRARDLGTDILGFKSWLCFLVLGQII